MVDAIAIGDGVANALHLVIPGLLKRWPVREQAGFPQPQCQALQRLLARATLCTVGGGSVEGTLFSLFGLTVSDVSRLPVAAVTRLYDAGDDAGEGWWLRADPVHLHADLHTVLLFDFQAADIGAAEARSLVAEINAMFGGANWTLDAPSPTRWYLRLADDPGLRTSALCEVSGRDLNAFPPGGTDRQRWNRTLTEIQMLLHASPVNLVRTRAGKAAINGVWPWGGGRLPQGVRTAYEVYADDPLTRGLARLSGAAINPLPKTGVEWRQTAADDRESLVVLDTVRAARLRDDPYRWVEQLEALEKNWMAECMELLHARALDELSIYVGDGRMFEITGSNLRRFWRRARPLNQYLA